MKGGGDVGGNWPDNAKAAIARFRDMPEEEFRLPEVQEELWRARVGSVGPGAAISLDDVIRDDAVVSALEVLRSKRHENLAERDAWAVATYKRLLEDINSRLTRKRPRAMLMRVFSILPPDTMTKCFDVASMRDVASLLLGRSARGKLIETHATPSSRGTKRGLSRHPSPMSPRFGQGGLVPTVHCRESRVHLKPQHNAEIEPAGGAPDDASLGQTSGHALRGALGHSQHRGDLSSRTLHASASRIEMHHQGEQEQSVLAPGGLRDHVLKHVAADDDGVGIAVL